MLTDDRECETCKGGGTIDMRLGGEWNSDPNSECPDCEGSGRIATRAIEAEVLQTQEPAGEIVMYAPYGKLSAPFARPEWRGGALPPVGTKLYTAPQPPAPCPKCAENASFRLLAVEHANVNANEALQYQKSIRDLQAKVAELEQFKQMWAISCAERDALQAKVAILDGLSQDAIDGGWTYRGMEAYAKGLEDKVAELEKAYKDKDAAATQLVAAMRDMAGKIKEQSAEIERLTNALNQPVILSEWQQQQATIAQQAALIEQLEKALHRVCSPAGDWDNGVNQAEEALTAIAAHRGQYSELAAQCSESRPQCSEIEKDAARINWLETAFVKSWNGVIDSGSATYWRLSGDYRHRFQNMNGATFRDAIDAAIAKDAP